MVFSFAAARAEAARFCVTGALADGVASGSSRGAKRFGLDAARRLREKARFERLLREGRRRSVAGYTFFLEPRATGPARLGLLVTRKHAVRATDRNRIKRCIREAFRLEQEKLGPLDVLVRPPLGVKPSAQMIVRLREALSALKP